MKPEVEGQRKVNFPNWKSVSFVESICPLFYSAFHPHVILESKIWEGKVEK
jgi:hypothetical protein